MKSRLSSIKVTLLTVFNLVFLNCLLSCNNPGQKRNSSQSSDIKQPNILFVIMDDWSWPHAGAYGDEGVKTPAFDRIAREGVLFSNAYVVAPSCTPSRGAILTGQAIHRLEEGGNLWSILPKKFPVYPDILEGAGYQVGYTGKGWDPGLLKGSGRSRNPAGPVFNEKRIDVDTSLSNIDYAANFEGFLKSKPQGTPFCFWYGSAEPHRKYKQGIGLAKGKKLSDAALPAFLPDMPGIRSDILDYYTEIEWADAQLGKILKQLEKAGELENTLIVVTGDNGMPFPRAKANLYDGGTRVPLAIMWPARIKGGQKRDQLVSFADFAPTFLEAAGLKAGSQMIGKSLLPLLEEKAGSHRNEVFMEMERHTNLRADGVGYPCRAIRTKDFLYIRNIKPDRWPAGDPPRFGDVDNSPSKSIILNNRDNSAVQKYFRLAFNKRPAEELYDLRLDSAQLENVAENPRYAADKKKLRAKLDSWMKETGDPRGTGKEGNWDNYHYYTVEEKMNEMKKLKK